MNSTQHTNIPFVLLAAILFCSAIQAIPIATETSGITAPASTYYVNVGSASLNAYYGIEQVTLAINQTYAKNGLTITPLGVNIYEARLSIPGTYSPIYSVDRGQSLVFQNLTVKVIRLLWNQTIPAVVLDLKDAEPADTIIKTIRLPASSSSKYEYNIKASQEWRGGRIIGKIDEIDDAGNLITYPAPFKGRILFTFYPGTHKPRTFKGTFITSSKTKTLQFQIRATRFDNTHGVAVQPNGTAQFGPLRLSLVRPQTASMASVQFPGKPSLFGMKILSATGKNPINVTTAKATFSVFSNRIEFYQKDTPRLLATAFISLPNVRLRNQNADVAILASGKSYLGIQADGVAVLHSTSAQTISMQGHFQPEYAVDSGYCDGCADSGTVFLADTYGGIATYPEYVAPFTYSVTKGYDHADWKMSYGLSANQRLLISTFPPREFDMNKSLQVRMLNDGMKHQVFEYPSNETIDSWARYTNFLHIQQPWKGNESWAQTDMGKSDVSPPYVAYDETNLQRVIQHAQSDGMNVGMYHSPASSRLDSRSSDSWSNEYSDTAAFLRAVKQDMTKYGTQAVYFDGIYVEDDIIESWVLMRQAREMLGDKTIYLHSTGNVPFFNYRFGAPFVDTYADFVFKSEALPLSSIEDPKVRYMVNQHNTSNSIGLTWYHRESPGLPFSNQHVTIQEVISESLTNNGPRLAWTVGLPSEFRPDIHPGPILENYYRQLDERANAITDEPTRLLYRCYHHVNGQIDHFLSLDPDCEPVTCTECTKEGPFARVQTRASVDTQPIYRCYQPSTGQHYHSLDALCEKTYAPDAVQEAVLGHVRKTPATGFSPLYRCWNDLLDHLPTFSSMCENAPGYQMETSLGQNGVMGYVQAVGGFEATPTIAPGTGGPSDTPRTFTLTIRNGTNYFSIPLQNAVYVSGTCSDAALGPVNLKKDGKWSVRGRLNQPGLEFQAGSGYAFTYTVPSGARMPQECTVDFKGSAAFNDYNQALLGGGGGPRTDLGWNFIGTTSKAMTIDQIRNNCRILEVRYTYPDGTSVNTRSLEPGKGYLVYSENECTLSQTAQTQTAPSATVTLKTGTNYFSVPLHGATFIGGTCPTQYLGPVNSKKNGEWYELGSITNPAIRMQAGVGYAVKYAPISRSAPAECTLEFIGTSEFTAYESVELYGGGQGPRTDRGWNFIGTPASKIDIRAVPGGCKIPEVIQFLPDGTPTNTWTMEPGYGYLVYAEEDCTLNPKQGSITGRVVQGTSKWIRNLFGQP